MNNKKPRLEPAPSAAANTSTATKDQQQIGWRWKFRSYAALDEKGVWRDCRGTPLPQEAV